MPKIAGASVGSDGWKNWQIALAVGVPAAVVGIYVYRKYKKSHELVGESSGDQKSQNDAVAQMHKKKGNKHFIAGRYEEAIECYTKAIDLGSGVKPDELSTFHQNRAAAYEHLKNYVQVISNCSRALELNPKYVKALNRRAKAFKETGFFNECLEDVVAACILENFNNQGNITLADEVIKELSQRKAVEKLKNRPPFEPSPIYVWSVLGSFTSDPVFKSKKVYCDNIENVEDPTSPYGNALKEFYADNYKNIIQLCSDELKNEGSEHKTEALLMRATMYFFKGEYAKSDEDLQAVLSTEGLDEKFRVNAIIKRAKIKVQKSQFQEAIGDFKLAAEVDPTNADLFMHRGQLYLIMEDLDLAILDFEKSISFNELNPTPLIHKCYTEVKKLRDEMNFPKAERATKKFEDVVKKFPKCPDGFAFYGQALLDLKKFEAADECFLKAIALEPLNPNPYVHRGILRISWKEDFDGAVEMMKKAIEVDGKSSFALQALGTLELQRGNTEEALIMINKAINVSSSEAEIAHLYSVLIAAEVQSRVTQKIGISHPPYL